MRTSDRFALTGSVLALAGIATSARPAEAHNEQDIILLWGSTTLVIFGLYLLVSLIFRLVRAWSSRARRLVRMAFATFTVLTLGWVSYDTWTDPPGTAEARGAKLSADLRAIGSAVSSYGTATGRLPAALDDLVSHSVKSGGPYLAEIKSPPPGWSSYTYQSRPDGTYTVSSRTDPKGRTYKRVCSVKPRALECEPNGTVRFSARIRSTE